MTMHANPAVRATAIWDRSIVAAVRDDVSLLIRLEADRLPVSGRGRALPADVVFVIDRSGSMAGDRLALVREATIQAVGMLSHEHRAAVVSFDNEVRVEFPLQAMTGDAKRHLSKAVARIDDGGSTNLSTGWLVGCDQLARDDSDRPKRAIVLTDGHANCGIVDPAELNHHASQLRRRGIVTSTMGVGEGFDEVLLTGMAEAGGGSFQFLRRPEDFVEAFREEVASLVEIVASRPQLELTLPSGYRARLLNRFPVERVGKTLTVSLRDLAGGDEIPLLFAVTHHGRMDPVATVRGTLRYIDAGTRKPQVTEVTIPVLEVGSTTEVAMAPRDNEATLLRAREEAMAAQQEALRLDREGQYMKSRMVFARSRASLSDAYVTAANLGFAAVPSQLREDYQAELARADALAAAAPAPLGEVVHKEQTAHHSRTSRGGRQR